MLNLKTKITLDKETLKADNLCERFDLDDLKVIGAEVSRGFEADLYSRAKWERRTEAAMNLAMQVITDKNFPWPNCSNVAFPLVTIAALQFHARAYPTIIQGDRVVRCRVEGGDPTGELRQTADRISRHMSYQVLEEDQCWEPEHDRLLISLPIMGCAFKKSYYSASKGYNVSEMVSAKDLVLDYYAKSVEGCNRKTQIIPLYKNEVHERVMRGTFVDVLEEGWYKSPQLPKQTSGTAAKDSRTGTTPPMQPDNSTVYQFLEQHVGMDLDGDGYDEPYIITVERNSKCVVRIVTRFDRMEDIERNSSDEIIRINPWEYFTGYTFIPSPDGSVYGVGFGCLLGPLNESVNTLINQQIDSGTMSIAAGGFLGRGAKIRGGVYTFAPFEWKRVDSTGEDLQKSLFPLPVREPSGVLFNLLVMLVNYTNRISGTTDLMVGESIGQNTTAEVGRTMLEQGMKIYQAIFKRVWRSMKVEFKKLYQLNAVYMDDGESSYGEGYKARKEDYLGNPDLICPVADPNLPSTEMQMQQIKMIKESAMITPGYNIKEVEQRFLKALGVDGIEQIYPGPDKVPQGEPPQVQLEKLKQQGKQAEMKQDQMQFLAELMEEQRLNNAQIAKLNAEAVTAIMNTQGDDKDRQINALNTMLGALKTKDERISRRIDLVMKAMDVAMTGIEYERERVKARAEAGGTNGGRAPAPGPAATGGNGGMGGLEALAGDAAAMAGAEPLA